MEIYVWGSKIAEVKCHFYHNISKGHALNINHYWCWSWSTSWGQVCQVSPLASSDLSLSKEVCYVQYTLNVEGARMTEGLHKLFNILLHGRPAFFLPLIYVFNLYLYHCWLMNIHFTLGVVIRYDFVYFVAKCFPALTSGGPFSWLLCPFDVPPSMQAFVCLFVLALPHFLPFQGLSWVSSATAIGLVISMNPGSFYWRILETKIWTLYRASFLLVPLSW